MGGLLSGRAVLVTGAGRGLGAGIAHGLARAGAHVCILDIDAAELEQTAHELRGEPGAALAVPADVTRPAELESAVDACLARWGRLDAAIANAALLPVVPFEQTSLELWQHTLDVNLSGVFNTYKAAWPALLKSGGGHLVAIASGASVRGTSGETAYCAAKHGIEGLTKALALEGAAANIAANTVGPGALIKPTSISRAGVADVPADVQARWADPLLLAPAFVWLLLQPPARYTGLRFDAGTLATTIAAEGYDFSFEPAKATLYPDDLVWRLADRERQTASAG